jgi:putative flippase GtrA
MVGSPSTRTAGSGTLGWPAKLVRYTGGSAVATVCSETAFLVVYGPLHVGPAWSSLFGWMAGMLPNYWLNRSWTWQLRGRPSVRNEILPYLAIILTTLAVAALSTRWAHDLVADAGLSDGLRWSLVSGSFLGVYVVMFLVRFLLLDRLFDTLSPLSSAERQEATGTDQSPDPERTPQ